MGIRVLAFLMKFLLAGLAVHFVVHTVVTYGLGLEIELLWAWKEIVL